MSENKKLAPKIRFKGFTDDWEQCKAKDLCSITTGKSNTQDQVQDGKYPFYIRSDVPVRSNRYLYDEEAVITIGDGNIGRVFHYVNGKFDLHQRCYKMADFKALTAKYFYYYFSTKFYERAMSMTAKATVDSVRLEMISDMEIKFPKSTIEQTNISELLTNLDNLITLHQRKHDKLVKIKSSLLGKMFPKNSSKIPEVRFKGFTDDWEQRKLGDISNSFSGGTPLVGNSEFYGGKIPFIRSGEIHGNTTEIYITDKGLNSSSAKLVRKGDILYALYGATSGEVDISRIDGAINQAILAIFPNKNYDNIFITNYLKKEKENIISTYLQGGQGNLSGEIVKNVDIKLPNYEEQKQIGKLFEQLDNLITIHQRKLDKLQNIKKSLLDEMFV